MENDELPPIYMELTMPAREGKYVIMELRDDGSVTWRRYDREVIFADNLEAYKEEEKLAKSILRRNRYDTVTGEWLGPDPEPGKKDI